MRIIITCAGSQHKWDNYLGVPSHLAPLKRPVAEPLLHRTVRQALEITKDVHITAPPDDDRYVFPGVKTHVGLKGDNEYTSTRELWVKNDRTILLLGDVLFTKEAMRTIVGYKNKNFQVFGRFGASHVTLTPYGEIFAASWWPNDFAMLDKHLAKVAEARSWCKRPAGWVLLRSIQGTPLNRHMVRRSWFTEINDWTDDIDFAKDYDRHPATRERL